MLGTIKLLKDFRSQRRGSIAVMAGIIFPIISVASLFALDHMAVAKQQVALQEAVDQAALTTVRGLRFVKQGKLTTTEEGEQRDDTLSSIADSVIRDLVEKDGAESKLKTIAQRTDEDAVNVRAKLLVETPFGSLTGLGGTEISATAEAQLYGARNICVIALGNGNEVGINMESSARIKSGDCGIYSNSTGISSVNAIESSLIDAPFICAAGGYTGGSSNVTSDVITDCPPVTDPLASRPLPVTPTACDHNYLVFGQNEHNVTLEPGHYCGGLIIENNADVKMNPGTYIISGGPLLVQHNATLTGNNVAILMDDEHGNIFFNNNALVDLSAPVTGMMAGIVIASRSICGSTDCHSRLFEIKSHRVSSLLGTIYVPEDRFIVNTTMPISDQAAFTIILSRFLQGQRSPQLVLNTNYSATNVPVPDGLTGAKSSRLIK